MKTASPLSNARAENSITPFTHIAQVFKFVHHVEAVENVDSSHEVGQTFGFDRAVDFKRAVANAYDHAATTDCTVGILCQGGEYFAVIGEQAFALDDLRIHGILNGFDVAEMVYTLKYLRKALTPALDDFQA